MSRFTIPMPAKAKCPRCGHWSRDHSIGTCLRSMPRGDRPRRDRDGALLVYLCGCAVWQGPRPWLGEGPAWTP